jgi:hypothetical protein
MLCIAELHRVEFCSPHGTLAFAICLVFGVEWICGMSLFLAFRAKRCLASPGLRVFDGGASSLDGGAQLVCRFLPSLVVCFAMLLSVDSYRDRSDSAVIFGGR